MRAHAILLAVFLLAGCGGESVPAAQVGQPLPTLAVETLDGDMVRLPEASAGQVTVIAFWASWCAPCRGELVALEALWRDLRGQGLQVVAVNTGDDAAVAREFAAGQGLSYPVLVDRGAGAARAQGVVALPTILVVDRGGLLRQRLLGAPDPDQLRKTVEDLL